MDSPKYKHFIEDKAEKLTTPGPIYDNEGNKLGDHKGLIHYTIGQRKGIGIAAGEPYYVKRKDTLKNALIVAKSSELGIDNFQVNQIHWINQEPPFPLTCDVKIRYRAKPIMCKVNMVDKSSASIKTYIDLRDITPGQFAVFYDGERVLGAGKITEAGTKW